MKSTLAPPATSTRSLDRSERIRLTRAAIGLKPAEKLLLRSLVDFMGNSSECWPSVGRLAEEVGVSDRHVRRMLRSLEAAGWIVTQYRFRPDRSQTSCVFQWAKAPDLHVRPPRTSASGLELNIGSIQESKTHAAAAECDFEQKAETPIADGSLGVNLPQPIPAPPAATEGGETNLSVSIAVLPPSKPAIPATQPRKDSPRFIRIDGSRFLDIQHGKDIYLAAVAGKLLNSGTADRLAFFACWCAIVAKLRAGKVQHPERMMRFLLDNRQAMSAYPDQASEQKGREAIRFLFPEKPYNPHG